MNSYGYNCSQKGPLRDFGGVNSPSRRWSPWRSLLLILVVINGGVMNSMADEGKQMADGLKIATFAGGCFWCMEPPFDKAQGVIKTVVGYTGGETHAPSYKEVSAGSTGHAEAIQVTYDPNVISYTELLMIFWHNIDPTTPDRQFCDVGSQYRTAIFYHDEDQKEKAEESRDTLIKSKPFEGEIVTEIVPAGTFYPAEEYHQDYYKKNPLRYRLYRTGCGRDGRLNDLWGEE